MRLDHVVLWTKDPRAAVDFYMRVVGLDPVRFSEFEAGEAPFPSVRVCADSIIDLVPLEMAKEQCRPSGQSRVSCAVAGRV